MRIFKLVLIQSMVVAIMFFVYEWTFAPVGESLEGEWETPEGSIEVPFLLETDSEVVLKKKIEAHEDTLVIPQFFGRFMEIRINGKKALAVGKRNVDTMWNEPVHLNLESGEVLLEIGILPYRGFVGMAKAPYISNFDEISSRFLLMKFLGSQIFMLAFVLPLFLSTFIGILSREFHDVERKLSYRLMALGLLMAGLAVLDYTPMNFFSVEFVANLFLFLNAVGALAAPVFMVAGIEYRVRREWRHTKSLMILSAVMGVLAFLVDARFAYLIELAILGYSLVLVKILDERYISPTLFYLMVILHDELTLLFSNGFPQLIPLGSIALSSGMTAIMVQEYGEIGRKLEKSNEELMASNEEIMAMNEELESMYKEQELTITKLENLINLTSRIVRGTYDFEDEEVFLKDILEKAVEIIPEADYGSVALVDGNEWRFIHSIGHDIDKLRDIKFERGDFIDVRRERFAQKLGDGVVMIENIEDKTFEKMETERQESFRDAVLPISKTLVVQLKADEEFLGHLTVDIAKDRDASFSRDSIRVFSALGNIASAFLAFKRLSRLRDEFQKEIILSIIHIVEIHDPYTKGHSESVARISVDIAKEMGFDGKELEKVYWAGLVHDLGKILVPGDILRKNGNLSEKEYELIKRHPIWSYETLIYSDRLKDIAVYTRHHHERWDGKGYPDGLRRDSIPLISRIIAVADTWDAMRSDRPYRKALSFEEALRRIEEAAGSQLDPEVTEVFLKKVAPKLR